MSGICRNSYDMTCRICRVIRVVICRNMSQYVRPGLKKVKSRRTRVTACPGARWSRRSREDFEHDFETRSARAEFRVPSRPAQAAGSTVGTVGETATANTDLASTPTARAGRDALRSAASGLWRRSAHSHVKRAIESVASIMMRDGQPDPSRSVRVSRAARTVAR